jgi:hypothetical protein
MAASTTLLQFLLMLVAGWLQRQQAATIDYLKAENRMLQDAPGRCPLASRSLRTPGSTPYHGPG